MEVLVILAHPDRGSFNHAIASAAVGTLRANRHRVIFHDLYEERFAPLLPRREIGREAHPPPAVARHGREASRADGIVVVHPNWWGQPPAILKGWIDRVLRPGVAYEFADGDAGEGVPRGLLKARSAVVFNTSNTARAREKAVFGDPLETLWKNCIFGLCGVPVFRRRTFGVVVTSSPARRRKWLDEAARIVDELYPRPRTGRAGRTAG